jgi:hypothetical protein
VADLVRQTSGVEAEPADEHRLFLGNEAAQRHHQQHAETEGTVTSNASGKQLGKTGGVLDPEAAAHNRIGAFAFDVMATLPGPCGTPKHPGLPEGYEPDDFEAGGVPPRKLAREPLGVGNFTQRPCVVPQPIFWWRLAVIERFEKRVALTSRSLPSPWAGSNDGSNSRLEIEPTPYSPSRWEGADLNSGRAKRLDQIGAVDRRELSELAKLGRIGACVAQNLRSLNFSPQ